ncbi:MAG: hypothetical protein ACI82A_001873, partial [Candidatus Azotimanducaceae bacterium]
MQKTGQQFPSASRPKIDLLEVFMGPIVFYGDFLKSGSKFITSLHFGAWVRRRHKQIRPAIRRAAPKRHHQKRIQRAITDIFSPRIHR